MCFIFLITELEIWCLCGGRCSGGGVGGARGRQIWHRVVLNMGGWGGAVPLCVQMFFSNPHFSSWFQFMDPLCLWSPARPPSTQRWVYTMSTVLTDSCCCCCQVEVILTHLRSWWSCGLRPTPGCRCWQRLQSQHLLWKLKQEFLHIMLSVSTNNTFGSEYGWTTGGPGIFHMNIYNYITVKVKLF